MKVKNVVTFHIFNPSNYAEKNLAYILICEKTKIFKQKKIGFNFFESQYPLFLWTVYKRTANFLLDSRNNFTILLFNSHQSL